MLYLLYIYKDKLLHLIGDLKGQWYSCTNKRDGIVSTLWQILNKSKHIETQNYEKMVVIEYDYDCWNQNFTILIFNIRKYKDWTSK